MDWILDVTAAHVAALDDAQLRRLVKELCEAELRRAGLPVSALIAGGHQDAPDGGLDLRIDLPPDTPPPGFIPRPQTGYQVKRPRMSTQDILKEMRPGDVLRPVIAELVGRDGAYVLICGLADITDGRRQELVQTMRRTAAPGPTLHVDFYDSSRLALWARQFPGVATWLRRAAGCGVQGWRGYENWSRQSEDVTAELIADDTPRLRPPGGKPLPIAEGLDQLREALRAKGAVVRLVGLSGTGKTRLVQALFDGRIGTGALATAEALYTDLAWSPEPSPQSMLERLADTGLPAVVIVDNCPPDTHGTLSGLARRLQGRVSLLTVEYDVRDDQPEGTHVFRLEAAPEEVIATLLQRQCPHLSTVNRHVIARYAGGNARVALALADGVETGESLANLKEEHLFNRLFRQRHSSDAGLLRAAEACAFVYSFDGTYGGRELSVLAGLAGQADEIFFGTIADLRDRGLIQERSHWRALLPHPIANRLASHALDRLPQPRLDAVMRSAPDRLLKSFTRRLGYLHECHQAREMAARWLSPGGLLADVLHLSEDHWDMVRNLAPAAPEATLAAIERALDAPDAKAVLAGDGRFRNQLGRLLRSLAYEPQLFTRAATRLAELWMMETERKGAFSLDRTFTELFQLYSSGTKALPGQRLLVIDELLAGGSSHEACGLVALKTMLKTRDLYSDHPGDFGMRPRDHGWEPTPADMEGWFAGAIQRVRALSPPTARSLMAKAFSQLWRLADLRDKVEATILDLARLKFWPEGWTAVRRALRVTKDAESRDRLQVLADQLDPKDLASHAQATVQTDVWTTAFLAASGDEPENLVLGKANQKARAFGREVACRPEVLAVVLEEFSRGIAHRSEQFGTGLSEGCENPQLLWDALIEAFEAAPSGDRNAGMIFGYLCGLARTHQDLSESILDAAVDHPVLAPIFPALQLGIGLKGNAIARLRRAAELKVAPASQWERLGWDTGNHITGPILADLVLSVARLPDGARTAGKILSSKLDDGAIACAELREAARRILLAWPLTGNELEEYHMARLIEASLVGMDAEEAARAFCRHLLCEGKAYSHARVVAALVAIHPTLVLDELLAEGPDTPGHNLLTDFGFEEDAAIDNIDDVLLLAWAAKEDARRRYPLIALTVSTFKSRDEEPKLFLNPIISRLLAAAPEPEEVLSALTDRLHPRAWSGSLAHILDQRREVLEGLFDHPDRRLAEWARQWAPRLKEWAYEDRLWRRQRDERFE